MVWPQYKGVLYIFTVHTADTQQWWGEFCYGATVAVSTMF